AIAPEQPEDAAEHTEAGPGRTEATPEHPEAAPEHTEGAAAQPEVAPEQPESAAEPAPRRDRKKLLRSVALAALLVVTGTATAVAVTLPDRPDLPGLATPNDGRYAFPALTLPPLPSGAAEPKDAKGRRHAADLRALVLPVPKGATAIATNSAGSAGASA